jgi:hypothetical protein
VSTAKDTGSTPRVKWIASVSSHCLRSAQLEWKYSSEYKLGRWLNGRFDRSVEGWGKKLVSARHSISVHLVLRAGEVRCLNFQF